MPKRPEQTAITVENLKQAFWSLYCNTPIEKISVAQVTQAAGYNRGTFYLHFRDIYDVLRSVEDDVLDGMRVCVQTCMESLDAGIDPESAMQQVLSFYEEHREYLVVLLGENGDPSFVVELKRQLKPLWATYVLKRPAQEGLRDATDGETDFILEYTLSGTLFMVRRWLENPHGVSAEKLLHLIYHSAIEH